MDGNKYYCSKKQFWLTGRFHKNTKVFADPQCSYFFSDLSLNIFLKLASAIFYKNVISH